MISSWANVGHDVRDDGRFLDSHLLTVQISGNTVDVCLSSITIYTRVRHWCMLVSMVNGFKIKGKTTPSLSQVLSKTPVFTNTEKNIGPRICE